MRGLLQVCLTRVASNFPKCMDSSTALKRTVAADGRVLSFEGLPTGAYAVAIVHDENGNDRLDTSFGIPREGFGFSRNPPTGFGPPRFSAARFAVGSGAATEQVRLKYWL